MAAFPDLIAESLLDNYLDAAVLRLAHVVACRHQQLAFALADDRDRLRRHAVADQSVLDRVGATQRQRHVVAFRTRRVGVAGRRDARAALRLEGARRLLVADAGSAAPPAARRSPPSGTARARAAGGRTVGTTRSPTQRGVRNAARPSSPRQASVATAATSSQNAGPSRPIDRPPSREASGALAPSSAPTTPMAHALVSMGVAQVVPRDGAFRRSLPPRMFRAWGAPFSYRHRFH
jgi:hypothetical protein